MKTEVLILVGYTKHSDEEIIMDTIRAIAFMTANPDYPLPTVPIAALQLLLNAFTMAFFNASDGGTELTALKNEARIPLEAAMVANGAYVQLKCGNVRSKAIGSGYYLGSTNTAKVGPLKKITAMTFSDGVNPGQTKAKVKKPANANSIIWMFSQTPALPRVWTEANSSRGSFTFRGLISGIPLYAKAAGLGADEEIVMSDEFTYPMVR
jgi:hypothetical protein